MLFYLDVLLVKHMKKNTRNFLIFLKLSFRCVFTLLLWIFLRFYSLLYFFALFILPPFYWSTFLYFKITILYFTIILPSLAFLLLGMVLSDNTSQLICCVKHHIISLNAMTFVNYFWFYRTLNCFSIFILQIIW